MRGQKCVSEGAKIQKFAENKWPIFAFFPSKWGGGGEWGETVSNRGDAPTCLLDATIAGFFL